MEEALHKTERLSQIEALLLAHPEGLSQAEIARRLRVHRSTIYRYLPELTYQYGVYETDDGRLAIDRRQYLTQVRLTLYEATALFLAVRMMTNRTGSILSPRRLRGAEIGLGIGTIGTAHQSSPAMLCRFDGQSDRSTV